MYIQSIRLKHTDVLVIVGYATAVCRDTHTYMIDFASGKALGCQLFQSVSSCFELVPEILSTLQSHGVFMCLLVL